MQGRRPIPTALKLLAGNPGKRLLNQNEPKPEKKIPSCPDSIAGEARKEWRRMSRRLARLGLVTEIDRAALAAYCRAWQVWSDAVEEVRKTSAVVKAPNGMPMLNPYLSVELRAAKQMKSFLVEFGMTPSSRSRIEVDTGGFLDDDDDLLG